MRTDVKVGLALGALFLIVAVSYYGTKKSNDTLDLADGSGQDTAQDMSKLDQVVQSKPAKTVQQPKKRAAAKTNARPGQQTPARRSQRNNANKRQNKPRTRPQPATQQPEREVASNSVPQNTAQPAVGNRLPENFRAVGPQQPDATAQETPGQPQVRTPSRRIPQTVNNRPLTEQAQRTPRQPRRAAERPTAVDQPARTSTRRPQPAAVKVHEVQSGDSFSAIAEKYYGSQSYTQRLVQANPDVDPRRMQIGTILSIPPLDGPVTTKARSKTSARQKKARPSAGTSYVVASGDTLYEIASRKLGDGARWREIHELNSGVIGNDPHALMVGMVLEMPR